MLSRNHVIIMFEFLVTHWNSTVSPSITVLLTGGIANKFSPETPSADRDKPKLNVLISLPYFQLVIYLPFTYLIHNLKFIINVH